MTKPIARLHALEMVMAVMIADRAAATRNGAAWLKDRKGIVLVKLADSEATVLEEVGTADGITAVHTAAAEIFDEASDILKALRPPPDVREPGSDR